MPIRQQDSEPHQQKQLAIRPLDMFLLALVKGGLITPYDWQTRARISLGASLPAVKRLLESDLLEKIEDGPRGRHEFGLTLYGRAATSRRYLYRYIGNALDDPPSDLESALRLACLATMIDDIKGAQTFLRAAADAQQRRIRSARKRAASKVQFHSRLGGLYSAVLTQCEAKHATAMVKKLDELRNEWDQLTKDILQLWEESRRDSR